MLMVPAVNISPQLTPREANLLPHYTHQLVTPSLTQHNTVNNLYLQETTQQVHAKHTALLMETHIRLRRILKTFVNVYIDSVKAV